MSTASRVTDARPRAPRTSPAERTAQIAAAAEALALEEDHRLPIETAETAKAHRG